MTEAELQDARNIFVQYSQTGYGHVARAGLALLDYVDFLHKLLHDLREESTAHARGVEEGRRLEREEQRRRIENLIVGGGTFEATIVADPHDV